MSWLAASFTSIVVGLLALTTTALPDGTAPLRVTGAVSLVFGLVVGVLAGPVRAGHASVRRMLLWISLAGAVVGFTAVLGGFASSLLLIAPVLVLVATVCAYRPAARQWFDHEDRLPDDRPQGDRMQGDRPDE
ncbi:hypothetical protein [Rhodococcus sp. HNM0569]|uniref:hypothetical protein n=1 Tax=Rhodococcus sp. HNM0569 TaxID=2716340 RepID=UPI00146DFF5C|nr:hypothetical protein [Rhodococcus sp. HNM0569]NLU84125.1 hypothetical protein [Rhodococcus sp. HNM0569]